MLQILDWIPLEVWHACARADHCCLIASTASLKYSFTSPTSAGNKQQYLGTIVPSGQPEKQVCDCAGLSVCALWCRHTLWPARADFSCVLQGMKAARLLGSKPGGKAPRSAPGMQASMMMYPGTLTIMQSKHR